MILVNYWHQDEQEEDSNECEMSVFQLGLIYIVKI